MEKGFVKPEDQEPEIGAMDFYILAFWELSSCRSIGMAIGPIPFTAIVEYSRIYIEEQDRGEFHSIIRMLDNEYLASESKKTTKNGKVKDGSANSSKTNPNRR